MASSIQNCFSTASRQRSYFSFRKPNQLRRHSQVVVFAGRAASHTQRSKKKEDLPQNCPCGSGLQFRECCGPIVDGAWARTAPELARARFAALVTGNPRMLAETTHPEALDAIGTKHALLKKMEKLMRRRGAGDDADVQPVLVNSVHGQSPDDPDSWFVLLAISLGQPGLEKAYVIPELYRKDGGRWWYMTSPRDLPPLTQFNDFFERYYHDDEGIFGPVQGRYNYSWATLPPRSHSSSPWSQQRLQQWFVDEWPADPAQQQQQQQGHQQRQPQSLNASELPQLEQQQQPGGWAYLDTAVDPETGLNSAQTAAQTRQLLEAALLDPQMDYETYYFRFGRYFA